MTAFLLATLASLANALSAIFQRIGVQDAPDESPLGLGVMREAFRHVIWFVGLALIGAGFLLQAVALRFGQLSDVQPIVTTELLFLVLILGTWFRYPLGWREWSGAAAAGGGLSLFLVVAAPGGGTAVPSPRTWVAVFVAVGAATAAVAAVGVAVRARWLRAAAFGSAGALMFALSAALTKQLTDLVTEGWGHVFVNWDPYAVAVTGAVGLVLAQSAYHAGPVTASQTTLTLVDPLVSVFLGIWLFSDHLDISAWRLPVELLALVVVAAGIVTLSTSPLVAGAKDERSGDRLERQPDARGRPTVPAPGTAPG